MAEMIEKQNGLMSEVIKFKTPSPRSDEGSIGKYDKDP